MAQHQEKTHEILNRLAQQAPFTRIKTALYLPAYVMAHAVEVNRPSTGLAGGSGRYRIDWTIQGRRASRADAARAITAALSEQTDNLFRAASILTTALQSFGGFNLTNANHYPAMEALEHAGAYLMDQAEDLSR